MNRFFPMFITLKNKKILVVGAGNIATRRIKSLLPFGADIIVVARKVSDELSGTEGIQIRQKEFDAEDLLDIDIAVIATDDRVLNKAIAKLCENRNIIKNVSTDQSLCDFYFPSLVIQDEIVVGINSGGKNPSKTKTTRKKIQKLLEE